tara:strand:- start:7095 stop:8270 length:1176 start_codon:yes stop_codon:yes gene_type:complete
MLSSWWDKMSGKNQKVDPTVLANKYDQAYSEVNKGYDELAGMSREMMDPYSDMNRDQMAMMEDQSAEQAAESARLGQRAVAMGGGNASSGAVMQQVQGAANEAQAGTVDSFNQYLQGSKQSGAGMLSGVLANQGQVANQKLQGVLSQEAANRQIDTNAAQFSANMLGKGMGIAGSFLNPAAGAMGLFSQEGGYVGMQEGGEWQYQSFDRDPDAYRDKHFILDDFMVGAQEDSLNWGTTGKIMNARDKGLLHQILEGPHNAEQKAGIVSALSPAGQEFYQNENKSVFNPEAMGRLQENYNRPLSPEEMKPWMSGPEEMGAPEGELNPEPNFPSLPEDKTAEEYYKHQSKPIQGPGLADGGYIYGGDGGMLSMVSGPKGDMKVMTRMGGQKIG